MSFYIGLSILSNSRAGRKKLLRAEARRILSLLAPDENSMAKDEHGRPFFSGQDIDFNISHSGEIAAVSLVRGEGIRTGCDIELVRHRSGAKEIAENFFSESERNYIFTDSKFEETRFYQIWTLKECYLKLKGLSVFDMPSCPSFIRSEKNEFSFDAGVSSQYFFRLYELTGHEGEHYVLAVVVEGTEMPPEIKWFSQDSFDCKITAEIKAAPNPAETVRPKI